MRRVDRDARWTRSRTVVALVLTLGLVIVPHAWRLPVWIMPTLVVLGAWRLYLEASRKPLPGRALRLALTALAALGVFSAFRHALGPDPFIAFLSLLTGLKLLEMRTRRDQILVVFLTYFLIVSNFLFNQSIPAVAYMAGVTLLATAILVDLADERGERTPAANLRLTVRLLAQALPLTVVVFYLFPRVSGQLWGLRGDPHQGRAGLSDSMSPGSISRVSLSDEVAFRAKFDGPSPPPALRYWRGPVFEFTDGVQWTTYREPTEPTGEPETARLPSVDAGPPLEYTVILEPHWKRWLFALDLPVAPPAEGRLTKDFWVRSHRSVRERLRYRVRSQLAYNTGDLDGLDRSRALQLPPIGRRVRALADRWRTEATNDQALVERSLAYFRDQPFVYTLTPPLLQGDPVDGFLFDTRRGFCEHYAAAFTTLMRVAGIPARVVTGYQGGEHNPVGGYYIVRQADAHAWSEVWLPQRGWVRVDPTAAVAPERIELPIDNTLLTAGTAVRFVVPDSSPLIRGLRQLRYVWDSIDNGWNQWVLGYGPKRQLALLRRLGFRQVTRDGLTIGLVLAFGALLAGVAGQMLWQQRARQESLQRAYRRYCRKLARRGLARRAHEGPQAFAERVCRERPDLEAAVREIAGLYSRLRYAARPAGPALAVGEIRHLQGAVRRFRPPRVRPRE